MGHILVTGTMRLIGADPCRSLLARTEPVACIDNINAPGQPKLKMARLLARTGILGGLSTAPRSSRNSPA